jgi:RNA polymerase sigma-70 factor (ECF subfamily)
MGICDETTEELILNFRHEIDADACFRCLFERYYGRVFIFFRRQGLVPEDAEELTQSTWLAVYKNLADLRDPPQFVGWLFRIAQNTLRNHWERGQTQKRTARLVELDATREGSADWDDLLATPAGGPLDALLEAERLQKLRSAMAALPEQMRRCLHLRVVQEMTINEIATALGLAPNTVKAHLFQARRTLATKLQAGEVTK